MAFSDFVGRGTLNTLGRLNRAARRRARAMGLRLAARREMAARRSSDNIPSPVVIENLESRQLLSASVYDYNGFYIPSGGPTINKFTGGGTVTFMGSSAKKNVMSLSLSSDGKTLIGTLNGVTSDFPLDMVSEIKIFGGSQGDSIVEAGNVTLPTAVQGGAGNDTIMVGNGNDTVDGSTGADSIVCGSGKDVVRTEGTGATLVGGSGASTLIASGSDDVLKGGSAQNQLVNSGKGDTLVPYSSTTSSTGSSGGAVPAGETGGTTPSSSSSSSSTSTSTSSSSGSSPIPTTAPAGTYDHNGFYIPPGGPSINKFTGGGTVSIIGNSAKKNTVSISLSSDGKTLICTEDGVTSYFPLNMVGEIKIFGGSQGDSIIEASNITLPTAIQGGAGNDTIAAGNGNDTIDGSTGADSIVAGNGSTIIRTEGVHTTLVGGSGAETLIASGSDDVVQPGSSKNDVVNNGKGDTILAVSSSGGGVPAGDPGSSGSGSASTGSTSTGSSSGSSGGVSVTIPSTAAKGTYDHNGFYIPLGGATIDSFTGGGIISFVGNANSANEMTVNISTDGKTLVATLDGVTAYFPTDMVAELKMWTGNDSDLISIASGVNVPAAIQANGSGNDSILAEGGGNITIHGNAGHDSIVLGAGDSDIAWGPGNYTTLIAGTGDDTLFASGDHDSIKGGPGFDELISSGQNDTVVPGSANNYGDFVQAVATPPVTSVLQPSIAASGPTTIEAGHMIAVQALNTGLPSGVTALTALFQWNFGDTTSGSQYNTLEGFNAAHEYNTPGNYTITLTVTLPDGTSSRTTMPITVLTPSVRTIYVSTSGNDNNNGLSPSTPIKTIAKADTMLSSNTQLLFEDGDTFDETSELSINGLHDVTIGSYGSGAQPVILWTGARDGAQMITTESGSLDVTINNLTFNSIYDQDTSETGMPFAIVPAGFDISIIGCTFLNVGYAVQGAVAPVGLLVENCSVPSMTGLRGYFVWVQGTDINIYGNNVVTSCDEHVIRDYGANRVNISYNTLQNLDTKATVTLEEGEYVYVYKNILKYGGAGAQTPQNANSTTAGAARMEWVVFDSNTATGIEFQVGPGTDHLMFRNNVSYISGGQAFNINAYNSEYGTNVSDLTIANNTAIDSGTTGNFLKTSSAGATGVYVVNNLFVAPSLEIGINGSFDVYLNATSTEGLTFSHNVWAVGIPTREDPAAEMYMDDDLSMAGMLSGAQWNAEPGVSDDHFADVTLNAEDLPASDSIAYDGGVWVAGVTLDAGGFVRSSGDFGVGAFLPEG